jgi:hypothetical protein
MEEPHSGGGYLRVAVCTPEPLSIEKPSNVHKVALAVDIVLFVAAIIYVNPASVKTALQFAQISTLLAVAFAAAEVGWTVHVERAHVDTLEQSFSDLVTQLSVTATNVQAATADWQAASQTQEKYWEGFESQAAKDLKDADDLIRNADLEVNTNLLPALASAVEDQDAQLSGLEQQTGKSLAALQADEERLAPVLEQAAVAMKNAADRTGDPALAEVAANLSDASKSMKDSAADVASFIHRETTPVRGTWNAIKTFLRDFAGPAGAIATAAK